MSKVRDFHLRYGHPAPEYPALVPDPDLVRFRARLLREEYEEIRAELEKLAHATEPKKALPLLRAVLKETVDLCYVAEGTAIALGLPYAEAFEEVHRSNMSKTPNGDKKPIKGPNYVAANMERLLPDHIDYEEVPSHDDPIAN